MRNYGCRREFLGVKIMSKTAQPEIFSGSIYRVGTVQKGNPQLLQAAARRK